VAGIQPHFGFVWRGLEAAEPTVFAPQPFFCHQPDQGVFMSAELNNTADQQDLKLLMNLKQKKRSRTIVDWLLGENQGRKALAEQQLLADKPGSAKLLESPTARCISLAAGDSVSAMRGIRSITCFG
jgi:hypothetical protein